MLQLVAVPAFDDNYLWLAADAAGQAVAVDPGDAEAVRAALQQRGWELRAILVTHHHPDHIGGVAELQAQTDAAVFAPDDPRIPLATRRVHDGERVTLPQPALDFGVMATPGHTTSHHAYVGAGLLFCGDTLFSLGCGRLFEGSPAQMLAALDRIAVLPEDTQVCCAHEYTLANAAFAETVEPGNLALQSRIQEVRALRATGRPTLPTRIGLERRTNPFLRVDAAEVVAWAEREHAVAPEDRVGRFAALRRAKDHFKVPQGW